MDPENKRWITRTSPCPTPGTDHFQASLYPNRACPPTSSPME